MFIIAYLPKISIHLFDIFGYCFLLILTDIDTICINIYTPIMIYKPFASVPLPRLTSVKA